MEKLRVCPNCLAAIESHEGRQCVFPIEVELTYEPEKQSSVVCDRDKHLTVWRQRGNS